MSKAIAGTILALMKASGLFAGASWDAWRAILRAIFGLPMPATDLDIYRRLTGRTAAPTPPFREVWLIIGRRGGKSIITALIVVYQTTCRSFKLAPGEIGVFAVVAADRRQARVIKSYVAGMLRTIGALEQLLEDETAETIILTSGLRIEITTASYRTIRGATLIGAACDEVAFWQNEDSANPDTEILAALRPAMATQPDAVLVCLTSPYARKGEVWKAYQRYFGQDDPRMLVVKADTRTMNPDVPQDVINAAYEDDAASAAAEYGAEFRTDVETFVSREVVDACVVPGRFELPWRRGFRYKAFGDPSGGTSDSFSIAVGHPEGGRVVIDAVREQLAPFDAEATVKEFADLMRSYRISNIRSDRYAGDWPRQAWAKHGIHCRPADKTKSELYQALLPRLSSATVELLDNERAIKQLLALERRTSRGGRDSIDHPPKGKDDVINAIAGVVHELRDGQSVLATISVDYIESTRDEMARCALADAERERDGTQSDFLNAQCVSRPRDDYGFPGRAEARRRFAQMTPQQRRDYGMAGRGKRR